ncbi:MAG: hypothetical protein JW996_07105 [Candidatus Cloacimonetes bacterium]|nr:hypothetical protein [Candidatus Cloacimonadota bacterium]
MNTNFSISARTAIFLLVLTLITTSLSAKEPVPQLNMLKSALIPGWGELSAGSKSGYVFLATEVLLWSANFYFMNEETLKEREAFNYAVKYANIDPDNDYNNTFYYHLSKYPSSGFEPGGYNSYILQQAEQYDDPIERQEFLDNNLYPDEFYWDWENTDKRKNYGVKRKDAANFSDYAKAMTGTIVVNHVISSINALRITILKKRLKLGMYFDPEMNSYLTCNIQF